MFEPSLTVGLVPRIASRGLQHTITTTNLGCTLKFPAAFGNNG